MAKQKKRAARKKSPAKADAPVSAAVVWTPRPYQKLAFDAFDRGILRMFLGWHRRAGKDSFGLNLAAREMKKVVGSYWHLYPLHVQAKRAIWRGFSSDGVRFIDQAFPIEDRTETNNQDMYLEAWGSSWQLCGSDYYDRLVGANVRGCVFSEWALCAPQAWDYIRPILRENNGWAVFISTFRGRNHAWQMAKAMRKNPRWYVDIRDITQTSHANGKPVITEEDVDYDRAEGMSEPLIRQEYYCDPMAASPGAYYGRAMTALLERDAA